MDSWCNCLSIFELYTFRKVLANCLKRTHMSTATSGLWFLNPPNVTAHGNAQHQHASNNMLVIVQLNFSRKFNIDEESGSSVVVQWFGRDGSDKADD